VVMPAWQPQKVEPKEGERWRDQRRDAPGDATPLPSVLLHRYHRSHATRFHYSYYHGTISREEAVARLQKAGTDGAFLLRMSATQNGMYTISLQ
jgi:hypothetical protein